MGNICNPLNGEDYGKFAEKCLQGTSLFNSRLDRSIILKKEMGEEYQKNAKDKRFKKLEETLEQEGKVMDFFRDEAASVCSEKNNLIACGYLFANDKYVEMTGPIGKFRYPKEKPEEIKFEVRKSGELAIKDPGEPDKRILIDTSGAVTHFVADDRNITNETVADSSVQVGKTSYHPPLAGIIDPQSDFFKKKENANVKAALGAPFLLKQPVEINNDSSLMTINPDISKRLKEDDWATYQLQIKPFGIGYLLGLDVFVNGVPLPMIIQIGTNDSAVIEKFAKFLVPQKKEKTPGEIITGKPDIKKIDKAEFKIGKKSVTIKDMKVMRGNNDQEKSEIQQYLMLGACGRIGTDVLSAYNYIIDPVALVIHIAPRKNAQAKE